MGKDMIGLDKMLMRIAEDERSIANKLAREEKRQKEPEQRSEENRVSLNDSTMPVCHSPPVLLPMR